MGTKAGVIMKYVDGFVIPIAKKNLDAYFRMAKKAGKIWREHGALEYFECAGDDLAIPGVGSFLQTYKLKPSETVLFSWIVYKSRAHRDKVNAKVMADPRLKKLAPKAMPFDVKKMNHGGFKVGVEL